jgi:hypothetical protein
MVLQFLLPLLIGGGKAKGFGGALGGLSQGGGFGLGYGFMVRAGYDLYGAIKDQVIGNLMGARYVPDSATSMMGTGGLMGMKHNPKHRDSVDTTTLNNLTTQQKDSLARKIGGAHKLPAYLKAKSTQSSPSRTSTTNGYKTLAPHIQRWNTQAYNLRHGKYDRFLYNMGFNYN